jgi:O-antigen/teichoic acid export membrane protein
MYLQIKTVFSGLFKRSFLTPASLFLISTMIVNAANYGYNLLLGRTLTPAQFSEAGFIITILLVFSFIGMTFQVVATKYSIQLDGKERYAFFVWIRKMAFIFGLCLFGSLFLVLNDVTAYFNLSDPIILIVLMGSLPIYFWLSVNRGMIQGQENFKTLSLSYQVETWTRFVATFFILLNTNYEIGVIVSLGIFISIHASFVVTKTNQNSLSSGGVLSSVLKNKIVWFLAITASYEISQVVINYADVMIVKHYFDAHQAGLYTSLSLIGKMIYFVTWMVVMLLIPKILKLKKMNQDYKSIMVKYVFTIALFAGLVTLGSFLFADLIVLNLFGNEYYEVSAYLWKYALLTSLFALSNVFVYYFLSFDQYVPVAATIFAGCIQLLVFNLFNESLDQIINVQIVMMFLLFIFQWIYFVKNSDAV